MRRVGLITVLVVLVLGPAQASASEKPVLPKACKRALVAADRAVRDSTAAVEAKQLALDATDDAVGTLVNEDFSAFEPTYSSATNLAIAAFDSEALSEQSATRYLRVSARCRALTK